MAICTNIVVGWFKEDVYRSLVVILARLLEKVLSGAILPLQALHPDLMCRIPGLPYTLVCEPYQSDGKNTLGIFARIGVRLPPPFCEASG